MIRDHGLQPWISLSSAGLGAFALLVATASAQVNGLGPSDSRLFSRVVNVPGDTPECDPERLDACFFVAPAGETIQLNINEGGSVGSDIVTAFVADSGSEVNISGGTIGDFFTTSEGSEVNITGGRLGASSFFGRGSVINISGGSVGDSPSLLAASFASAMAVDGSVVNISGGSISKGFQALSGSEVNLFGSGFLIDGAPLNDLAPGETRIITEREVTLSGLFADGSPFSFDLNLEGGTVNAEGEIVVESFSADGRLTVTLVPEPTATVLAASALFAGMLHRRHRG